MTQSAHVVRLSFVWSLVALISCSKPYHVEYMEDSLRQTTQPELIHKFGYTQRLKVAQNGNTIWQYDFQGKGQDCANYVITFTAEEELRQWERRDCNRQPPMP